MTVYLFFVRGKKKKQAKKKVLKLNFQKREASNLQISADITWCL